MKRKHLVALGLLILLVAAAAGAKTRKGDNFVKQGRVAEAKGNWDKALRLYEQAVDEDPSDVGYLVVMRKARFEAGQKHVNAGQKLRVEGKLEEALQEFQKALMTDPASAIALQETKRIHDLLRGRQGRNQGGGPRAHAGRAGAAEFAIARGLHAGTAASSSR